MGSRWISACLGIVVAGVLAAPAGAHEAPSLGGLPAGWLTTGAPAPGVQAAQERYRVLLFNETSFVHDGGPSATQVIQDLGAEHDFSVDVADDSAGVFTDEGLAPYDAVVFNSNNGTILNAAERNAFERYIHAGGGYVGIHSASNSDTDWDWYTDLLAGGRFLSHPAGSLQFQDARLVREDAQHPSTVNLEAERVTEEEWYNYPVNPRDNGAHVLLTVDESTYEPGPDGHGDDHPISWCNAFDGGRVWYTALGHKAEYWSQPELIEHVRGGIEWAAGAAAGDCGERREGIPTDASFEKVALDDNTANPMELAIAPDGRVFYVELGGTVKVYKPDTGAVVTAAQIPVHRGNENGLLGIALDPAFASNGWVYLFYSAPEPEVQHVSRFTVEGDTLDMDSEEVLLEIPHQRIVCCHSAGSMAFGPDGNLFISTGDDTAWFDSDGYSPHDDRVRGSPDQPPDARHAFDARRSAGNTNDLRGKILRIRPEPDGTYSIPEGNLFPPGASDPELTRPEIYTMGHRNPFRIAVDQETGWVYNGEVGPDSNTDNLATRGPRGYDEFNQIREAGNYGWPYCIADNKPYVEYDWATQQSGEPFDCENGPRNDSAFNTGLDVVPPAKSAFFWYPYGASPDFPEWPSGGGRAAFAGGVYHFDESLQADGKFPEYYDDGVFVMEWSRNFIGHITLDENGDYAGFERFMPNELFRSPHDMAFGPDGNMYLLEWGIDFNYAGENVNPDSGLYRISYVKGERTPVARASASRDSGPTPLEVSFTGETSSDPDGDEITFLWDFGDGATSEEVNPTHTFTEPGVYTVRLTVTDSTGRSSSSNVTITAGNTEPVVSIEAPRPGTFFDWGTEVSYRVGVVDAEDGSGEQIDCERVTSQPGIFHDEGGSPHVHPGAVQTGCEGTAEIPLDSGHDAGAKLAFTVQASYTDLGGEEGAPELTGSTLAFYNPKTVQAEHHSDQSGTQISDSGSAAGGQRVAFVDSGDWISFTPMDLGDIGTMLLDYTSGSQGGFVEVRLDAPDGPLVGRVDTPGTGGWNATERVAIEGIDVADGVHEVFLVFGGGDSILDLDQIVFRSFEDLASPQVTASADPASGWAPLAVQFTATAEHPEGDEMTFAWDFGDGSSSEELNPTHTYAEPGTYQAVLTATDTEGRTGRQVVDIQVTEPPAGCEAPSRPPPRSDEFDGDELNGCRWSRIVREDPDGYRVGDGALTIDAGPGDMFGGSESADNLILQPAPQGEWTIETLMTYEAAANYQQAGLMLYGDDDNWAKFGLLHINGRVLEYVWEQDNSPRRDGSQDVMPVDESFPSTLRMRLTSDGTNVTASFSLDGEEWEPLGRPVPLAAIPDPHVGLFAFRAGAGAPENTATFDYFRVTPDEEPENAAPVIEAVTADPSSGPAPLDVDFTVEASDADGDELSYSWDFDGDGTEDAADQDPSYTYTEPGDYEAEVTVSDGQAETAETVDVTVLGDEPGAPTVQGFADPSSGSAPLDVRFSATGLDPDGGRLTYRWEFGDGGQSFAANPRHTYTEPGIYTAVVTATDPAGQTGTDEVQITVSEAGSEPPAVTASADVTSGQAPLRVRFEATGEDPDGPNRQLTYAWTFGDGGQAFGRNAVHRYMEPGTYTATVTVTDAGGLTASDEVEITVTDPPGNGAPSVEAAADPASGAAPLRVRFSSQGTDPDGDRLEYAWEFGDGGTADRRNATHWYAEPGTYTATVTVTDRDGATGSADVEVEVAEPPANGAPTVQAAADPASGAAPLRVRFTSAARDPDNDPLMSVWDFGDGVQAGGRNAVHTYTAPGTYTATVTVTDPDGATGTAQVQVTVTGATVAPAAGIGGPAPSSAPAPAGDVAAESVTGGPQVAALAKRQRVGRIVRRGLRYRVTCEAACRVSSKLRISRRTARRLDLAGARTATRLGRSG
ncbi:MAG: PKD domain-containing protein, partial [Solirubrobacteraceae bacterium]